MGTKSQLDKKCEEMSSGVLLHSKLTVVRNNVLYILKSSLLEDFE
jgi:hypothetical protein